MTDTIKYLEGRTGLHCGYFTKINDDGTLDTKRSHSISDLKIFAHDIFCWLVDSNRWKKFYTNKRMKQIYDLYEYDNAHDFTRWLFYSPTRFLELVEKWLKEGEK